MSKLRSLALQFRLAFFSLPVILILIIILYAAYDQINNQNQLKHQSALQISKSVIEKVDRNFYERFGDVQAYAANVLAYETAIHNDSVKSKAQQFVNTMISYYVLYDLMMIIDRQGNIVMCNTIDKQNQSVQTGFLLGKNVATMPWFQICVSDEGPQGGAWYSDLIAQPDVARIYNSKGLGMEFVAPIKSPDGSIVGVWYNFASWKEVTQGIRQEALGALRENEPNAEIFITNDKGIIIDATNEELILRNELSLSDIHSMKVNLASADSIISSDNYIFEAAHSQGAYTYKGKSWNCITAIPEVSFSLAMLMRVELGIIILIVAFISFFLASYFGKNVTNKILYLKNNIVKLSEGDLSHDKLQLKGNDELNEMEQAILQLTAGLKQTSNFAAEVGKGNFNSSFKPLSEKDTLGNALLQMRDDLKANAEEDQKRIWISTGLAKFGDLLRNTNDFKKLAESVISQLVRYVNGNQGALFILNDRDASNVHLEMAACYAYDRKKFLSKAIHPGDGIIGQAFMEKGTTYLKEVPADFVTITSGLGECPPKNVLIVPLIDHDQCEGVIELASFNTFEPHHIEFVEKLAQSLASSLANIKTNEQTRMLLAESQQRTEQMRSQEEEMRQNLEELSATQEEMQRKEREYVSIIESLKRQ